MNFNDTRHKIVSMSALLMFSVVLTATILVPMFVKQNPYFTYFGVFNSCLYGSLYLAIRFSKPATWHIVLLCTALFLTIIPLLSISGGVSSQFIVLLPIMPIPLALIANSRVSWSASIAIIILVLVLLFCKDSLPDLTKETVSEHKARSRAIWLIFATIISATFVMYFDRANRSLRHKLTQQAFEDELTGIANRRFVMQVLNNKAQQARVPMQWVSVLMIDVDYFKQYNDKHGHLSGDQCLIAVAQCIKQSIRAGVDEVGRYGGEEFLVVLDEVDSETAMLIAEKIRTNVQQLDVLTAQGQKTQVTVTIGLCSEQLPPFFNPEELLHKADDALYQGKKQGRNCVLSYSQVV